MALWGIEGACELQDACELEGACELESACELEGAWEMEGIRNSGAETDDIKEAFPFMTNLDFIFLSSKMKGCDSYETIVIWTERKMQEIQQMYWVFFSFYVKGKK